MSSPHLQRQKPVEWRHFASEVSRKIDPNVRQRDFEHAQSLVRDLYELPASTLEQMGNYALGAHVDQVAAILGDAHQRKRVGIRMAAMPSFERHTSADYLEGRFFLSGVAEVYEPVIRKAEKLQTPEDAILTDAITSMRWLGRDRKESDRVYLAGADVVRVGKSVTHSALGNIVANGSVEMLTTAAQAAELFEPWDEPQKSELFAKASEITASRPNLPSMVELMREPDGHMLPERQQQLNNILDATLQGFYLGRE